jgi:hypothetical protein
MQRDRKRDLTAPHYDVATALPDAFEAVFD